MSALLSHLVAKMGDMAGGDVDAAIAKLSRRQHGAFNRAQGLAAGGTDAMIQTRLRTGQWLKLAGGVYASASVAPTWHRQVMAATLAHRGLVAAGGPTAALLYGADGFRRGRIQLVVGHDMRAANPLACVRRTRHLLAADVVRVVGIPTLSMERLAVDLAPRVDRSTLGRLIDRGVILKKLDPDRLLHRTARILRPNDPAARVLADLASERWTGTPPTQSELESSLYDLLDEAGYTTYVRQAMPSWFEPALDGITLDTLFPEERFILETDGRLWHARLEQWERDMLRDAVALSHGYVTCRASWRMVVNTPEYVLKAVERWIALPL